MIIQNPIGQEQSPGSCYLLDQYILNPNAMTLIDSTTNQLISQDEKLITALTLLVSRYPDIVTKDELMNSIWPNLVVTEWSITRFIADARKILGERNHIKTVHGRGYRYVYPVQKLDLSEHFTKSLASTNETEKSSNTIKIRSITYSILIGVVLAGCFWAKFQPGSFFNVKQHPNIALLPAMIDGGNPAWQWGIPAILKDKLRQSSINIVNFSSVKYEYDLWQKEHPNTSIDEINIDEFCKRLQCSMILIIRQNGKYPDRELQYRLINESKLIISKGFEGSSFHESLQQLWLNLAKHLDINDPQPLLNINAANVNITEDYTAALGHLFAGDKASAEIALNKIAAQYPDFFSAMRQLAEVYLSQHNPEKAAAILNRVSSTSLSLFDFTLFKILQTQTLLQQKNSEDALALAEEAVNLAQDSKNNSLVAISLLNRGITKLALNKLAIDDFNRAEEIFLKHYNIYAAAKTQLCSADSYELEKKMLQADETRTKANQTLDQLHIKGDRICKLRLTALM